MKNSFKAVQVFVVLAVIAVIGVGVGILVTKGKDESGKRQVTESATPTAVSTVTAPPPVTLPARRPLATTTPSTRPPVTRTGVPAIPTAVNTITNWEDRLDEILGADTDEKQKGQQLLAMFPNLDEEGQIEIAQHLSNLLEDEDFPALAAYATNSALPESVLDVLLSDALNRPNTMKLPLLLEVARNPEHPKAVEAKDLLELYLEEDYGDDWARWAAQLEAWLKDNPE